ncbi:hypothetical protein HRbin40_01562 [bacterium HR40]|nr:hypothetical protein HRbin40_01562 [bacterium HR40]
MKIHIEVDCTPEEARRFLGLPDIGPMQSELVEILRERLVEGLRSMDAARLMEQWLPFGTKGLEQWQNFWMQLAASAVGTGAPKPESGSGAKEGRRKG